MAIINIYHDLFESLYEVLHFEPAKVKTFRRSGIEAARNPFNGQCSQHSAIRQRSRHPQSQGAVERLNGVVQDKLAIWT
ncbi:hypothetical protein T4D_11374 [Trichinella pseudospiralis]|uniref:Uncharacterized protein n=1 Tax=Trichinella pseudospiralis TaxID=6337 RepID=A0A0V1F9J4_TRIPS|nr:hypothetical protein T4D_11374 [Trichinella pseudospiralis]